MINLNEFFTQKKIADLKISAFSYTEDSKALHYEKYLNWIQNNKHGPLNYLADHRAEIRKDVKNFFPDFKSAIVMIFSYADYSYTLKNIYHEKKAKTKIASYTLGFEGLDYHLVLKEKLDQIAFDLKKEIPHLKYQISLDIHPVLERDLGLKSGLGWIGKNSMLINKSHGSFFIIATILTDQLFNWENHSVETDHCGQCTRCVDQCPTSAIDPKTRTIIAKDCISTFTIEEFKLETVPSDKMNLKSGFIFGCDICQDVCPWNERLVRNKALKNVELNELQKELVDFWVTDEVLDLKLNLEKLSNNEFKQKFKQTSFFRSGKRGLLKNILFYSKNI